MTSQCSIALLEAALAGSLPADEEASLHRHLEECASCGAALEQMAGGASWGHQAAALLAGDDLDEAVPIRDDWSEVDFTVEHLEPADEPNVLGRLGGYDVLEIIGRGGMGVVLKAFDRELKRCVAIKVLAPHLAHSALAKKRFAREAQAAAAVVHPHVLAIHHVQPGGRLPFLVMPLVAGESLAERLATQGALELREILRIGMQAAAGLAAAHGQGLVHRDVKPANILLERGVERAVLTDFGLARAADDVAMTRWGIIAGTPQYMSPEQAKGEPLDGRSDLFSLGCVLYEMATGVSPFRTDSVLATMRRLVDDAPPALASLNPELPPWFIAVVDRLLEKDPSRRFGSAKEVSELLEGCLAHVQQPAAVPLPAALPRLVLQPNLGRRQSRYQGALAMFAILGIGLFGAFGWLSSGPPDIAGQWTGEDWGTVVLAKTNDTEYTGTYTDTIGKRPGAIQLRWSRIERRFNGTWNEGEDRFGELSVRLVDNEIRGALTTDARSKINPGTPHLSDLLWMRAKQASTVPSHPSPPGTAEKEDAQRVKGQGNQGSATLRPRQMFRLHTKSRVIALAYSPDGKTLAIGGDPETVSLLDARTGKPIAAVKLFSAAEKAILAAAKRAVSNVEVRTLAFTADSTVLAVGNSIGQVKLFDAGTGAFLLALDDVVRKAGIAEAGHKILELRLAQGNVWSVAFSSDGKLLATCGDAIDYNQDGVERSGLGPRAGLLKLWDAKTGELKQDLQGEHSGQVLDVAFSPDGKTVASAGHWGWGTGVKLWGPRTGKITRELAIPRGNLGGGSPSCFSFSADGKRLVMGIMQYDKTTGVTSGSIHVVYPASGILDLSWPVPRSVRPVAFSPDGKTIAALSAKSTLTFWDSSTGLPKREIRPTEKPDDQRWETFAFAPKGNTLAIGGIDVKDGGFIEVWDLEGAPAERKKDTGIPRPMTDPADAIDALEKMGIRLDRAKGGLVVQARLPVRFGFGRLEEAVPHLRRLPKLALLAGHEDTLTTDGFLQLATLPSLEELELHASKKCPPMPWQALRTVRCVRLSGGGVDDGLLEAVSAMPAVTSLHLNQVPTTPNGLGHLKRLRNLDTLVIQSSKVTAEGVQRLGAIEKLQSLTLCGNDLGAAGFAHLGTLTGLTYLNLESTRCTDNDVVSLTPLANLAHLDLGYNPGVTDAGLQHLARLEKLTGLRLYRTKVTDDGVAKLKKALPRLVVGK